MKYYRFSAMLNFIDLFRVGLLVSLNKIKDDDIMTGLQN